MDTALRSIDLVFLELEPERAIPEGLMILGENIGALGTAILVRQAGAGRLTLDTLWTSTGLPVDSFNTLADTVLQQIAEAASPGSTQTFRLDADPALALVVVPLPTRGTASAFLAAILPQERLALAEPVLGHCALSVAATRGRLLAEKARQQAADEAMAARRISDLLLARVGHEFRTPLVALVGISTLLDERGSTMPPGRLQSAYQLLRQNGERLSALVDKLMTVARIRAGKRPLHYAPVDFDGIIRTAEATMTGLLVGKPVSFGTQVDKGLPPDFSSDQAAILEILDNLLGNAAKFTAQGRIDLSIKVAVHNITASSNQAAANSPVPSRVIFAVQDSGIGMDPGLLTDLNQAFHASRPGLAGETGSGLGLAIATSLVEQLGGTMTITLPGTGGTLISFTLPYPGSGQT